MNMPNIPMSTAQMFETQPHRSVIEPNIVGTAVRAEQYQDVFESPISQSAQTGSWINKFTPRRDTMTSQDVINTASAIDTLVPMNNARNIIDHMSRGLEHTHILGEPLWNSNIMLEGQPPIDVHPEEMRSMGVSSHGEMGYRHYFAPHENFNHFADGSQPSWFSGVPAQYVEK